MECTFNLLCPCRLRAEGNPSTIVTTKLPSTPTPSSLHTYAADKALSRKFIFILRYLHHSNLVLSCANILGGGSSINFQVIHYLPRLTLWLTTYADVYSSAYLALFIDSIEKLPRISHETGFCFGLG